MARANTKTDICNLTLTLLKTDIVPNIETPSRNSKAANLCNQWYDESRRFVLAETTWDFAMERVQLPAHPDAPAFGWGTKFELPANYIRLGFIGDEERPLTQEYYKIEKGFILTDEPAPLNLGYVFDQEDISKFSSTFIQLLARKIGCNLAFSLTGNRSMVEAAEGAYARDLSDAMTLDAQQSPPRRVQRSKWASARQLGHTNRGY